MAFTHKITQNWSGGGRTVLSDKEYTGAAQLSIAETAPASTPDTAVTASIDVSAVQAIYIKSDQDITLETNDGAAPTDTIALKANVPYIFNADQDSYFTNLLTTDVTMLYLTNAGATDANFELECVSDPTP